MSLMRMPLRRPAVYGAVRCYATGGPRGTLRTASPPTALTNAPGLLDILSDSPSATKRQPSAPQPGEKQPGVMMRMANQALAGAQDKTSREIDEFGIRNAYQKQIHRKWNPGDVYAPHDLSGPEQKKWKTGGRRTPQSDAFDTLGMNPIHNYKVRLRGRHKAGADQA